MEKTKKLKKWYCQECGGEVWFTYEQPSATFAIDGLGKMVRVDNNDFLSQPGLVFHCEHDVDHKIEPHYKSRLHRVFMDWCSTVENDFYDNSRYGEL